MATTPIAVSGNGVMGQLVHKALETELTLSCIGCIEPKETSLSELSTVPSGIIDFSHPDCLTGIIEYVTAQYEAGYRIPVVIATTGFTEQQKDQIKELSCLVPVVFSSNFSIGVTLLHRVLREFSPLLIDWDKEIVEMHHNRKVDAPSGTALSLAHSLDPQGILTPIYGRGGSAPRKFNEIGIHAVRGGSICGNHDVIFAGPSEVLTFRHEALDRSIFAHGAIRAMKFALVQTEPRLYTMEDVMSSSQSESERITRLVK